MDIVHGREGDFRVVWSQSDRKLDVHMKIVRMTQEVQNREKVPTQTGKRALMETLKRGKGYQMIKRAEEMCETEEERRGGMRRERDGRKTTKDAVG